MPLRSLAKYIKNRRKKEKTFEEKLKTIQLIYSMANEMKLGRVDIYRRNTVEIKNG